MPRHAWYSARTRSLGARFVATACLLMLLMLPAVSAAQDSETKRPDQTSGQRVKKRQEKSRADQKKGGQDQVSPKASANRRPQNQAGASPSAEARRRAAQARRLRQKMAGKAMPNDAQPAVPVTDKRPTPKDAPNGKRPGQSDRANGAALMQQWMRRLAAADTNDDGKLSLAEAPEALKERFDRIDTNQDGLIEQSEIRVAVGRLQQRMGQDGRPAMNAEMAKRMRERLQQQQRENEPTGRPVKPIRPGKLK